jgi:hypothetical protein
MGVDSAWEQEKLEARKLLENRAESPASSAPKKIARDHFIRENVNGLDKRRGEVAVFSKKGAFFTVSRLRSENALLGGVFAIRLSRYSISIISTRFY